VLTASQKLIGDRAQSVRHLLLSLLLIALTVISRRYSKMPSQVVEFVELEK